MQSYNSEIPPNTNCQQQQQQQQQFRLPRNINMATANSQIPGKNDKYIIIYFSNLYSMKVKLIFMFSKSRC